MIINYILSIVLILRVISLNKKNKLFTIQGLLLVFAIFYLLVPLNIFILLNNLQVQSIHLRNINIEFILYNINLLLVFLIIISFIKTYDRFNIPKKVALFRYLLYFLFFFNSIIFLDQLYHTNYSDFINFNRNALLDNFNSHFQNSYVFLSRLFFISLTTAYAISNRNIKYFILLIPIFLSDIFILGRTFILMIILAILSYFYFIHKKINLKKLFFFVLLIFFLRNILTFNFTLNLTQGNFEVLGEFMNVFGGILMFSSEPLKPYNSLMDYYISAVKPLFINKFIPIGWPHVVVPAITINNFFKENYHIYGLAGSAVSEMILYKQNSIFILLALLIFIYLVNVLIKINSFTIKIYYIFVLIQVPSIFRWSLIFFLVGNINALIYVFMPLLFMEYFLLKKFIKTYNNFKGKTNDNS
jgi:hypothetical protein